MKNMTKNKTKLYTLIALAVIIGILAFLQSDTAEYSYQISILERSAIYAVVAVSMNLLTGFTGLFSWARQDLWPSAPMWWPSLPSRWDQGQRILCKRHITGDCQCPAAHPRGPAPWRTGRSSHGCPYRNPVLRLKSDYLAIATLGFSEIIRAFIAAPMFDTITNGSYGLKSIPGFPNIFAVFGLAALCIALMVLLINSSYGRAFKSIREDEVAAQSMGINLFPLQGAFLCDFLLLHRSGRRNAGHVYAIH